MLIYCGVLDGHARRPQAERRRPRHSANWRRHRRQRAVVRLRGARAHLQERRRQGGQRAALSPRRASPRGGKQGRPWSFDGDGALFRLVSEAQRIRLAHLFDPVLAVHTSIVDPLPHQITAVYEAMLPRQPLRFLLADDPGAGKTIMAGLLIKELIARGDLQRCLDRLPGQPGRAVAGRALPPLPPAVRDPDQRQAGSRPHRQLVPGDQPGHRPARQALPQRGRAAEAPGAGLPLGPRRLRRSAQAVGHLLRRRDQVHQALQARAAPARP